MSARKSRQETLSVTGHRWHKLPFGTNEKDPRCIALIETMTATLSSQFDDGITHVIVGMALGFDILVAEAVIRLRKTRYPNVTLEAALFCPGQSDPWTAEQRERFNSILQHCQQPPTITSPVYKKGCEMIRNRYMVDSSRILLACWDGMPSGTGITVKYAVSVGVPYIQINPKTGKLQQP